MLRRIFLIVLLIVLAFGVYVALAFDTRTNLKALPPLESGDLIFDTTVTNQSLAIIFATGSLYTHVGIIHKQGNRYTVIQAAQAVVETPLDDFIYGAFGEKFTIKRYPNLSDADRSAIIKSAQGYLGCPYNYLFYMKRPEIYCSELPYFAFNESNKKLGTLQKIGDLHVNNWEVRKIFDARWKMHPACQKPGMNYQSCWDTVMQEPIITPVNLARDPKLTTLFDNYPF